MPARPVDGKLRNWIMSTRAQTKWSSDEMELGLDERGDEYLIFRDDMPPAGCKACGGPYPYCKASCKMFDD